MHTTFDNREAALPQGEAKGLLDKAAQCRRLAGSIADRQTSQALMALATEYERDADRMAARA